MASKHYGTSKKKADDLRNSGYPNEQVVCTTDWTNLNKQAWCSVTVGRFSRKPIPNKRSQNSSHKASRMPIHDTPVSINRN